MFAETAPVLDPWRFQAHPEVWVLVIFLVGAYIYMARVIGPKAVPAGVEPVSKRQWGCFTGAVALFWIGADWPVHDIGEQYLYSAHMLQHMIFTYFMPPLALMAIPGWMARTVVGDGRGYRVVAWFAKPVIAGVLFNLMVMITHIPGVVNASVGNGPLHYTLHLLLVTLALLMWTPVVGPFPELQMGPGGKCIYLFLMSVIPTVPAGWLVFAEGAVYKHYSQPVRIWGITVTDDQQIAGAIMKLGGAAFLWAITIYLFFKKFGAGVETENTYVRKGQIPTAEITGHDEVTLTYGDVEAAFQATTPSLLEAEQAPREQR
ncbi:MAG: cytochrome c oxidase assembly protein [Ilumatobacteraceae bacterium]